ncbi:MAG: hypothetical protein WDO15_11860 [Bacteroidota bacterium]
MCVLLNSKRCRRYRGPRLPDNPGSFLLRLDAATADRKEERRRSHRTGSDFFKNTLNNLPYIQRPTPAMKVNALCCIIFLLTIDLAAQDLDKINALREDLKSSKNEAKFTLLNKLAWEYRSSFPDSAIRYADAALDLARSLRLERGRCNISELPRSR